MDQLRHSLSRSYTILPQQTVKGLRPCSIKRQNHNPTNKIDHQRGSVRHKKLNSPRGSLANEPRDKVIPHRAVQLSYMAYISINRHRTESSCWGAHHHGYLLPAGTAPIATTTTTMLGILPRGTQVTCAASVLLIVRFFRSTNGWWNIPKEQPILEMER